jgi:hypothetical protein
MGVARRIILILGVLAAAVLLASLVADEQALSTGWLAFWPECAAKRAGGSCALCGMSHAFVAMSRGQIEKARGYHPFSPWVYAGFYGLALAGGWIAAGTFRK